MPMPKTAKKTVSKSQELINDGKFDEAIELLESARKRHRDNAHISEVLSKVLSDRGAARVSKMNQPESGFKDFLRAVEVNPQNWRALVNLCSVAQARGDFDLALKSGKEALTLHPELRSNTNFMQQLSELESHNNQPRGIPTQKSAPKFCSRCGIKLIDPRKFCPNCGNKL